MCIEENQIIQYTVIGTTVMTYIGGLLLGFKTSSSITRKLKLPLIDIKKYYFEIVQSYVDLITCVGFLIICAGIIQVKSLLKWINDDKLQAIPFRSFIIVQVVLTILNIICIIPTFILLCFPWRLKIVLELEKKKYEKFPIFITENKETMQILRSNMWKHYLYTRAIILTQTLQAIIDIPFIILVMIISVFGWRTIHLWNDILAGNSDISVRKLILSHFIGLLVDIPFALMSIVLFISIFKMPVVVIILKNAFLNHQFPATYTRKLILQQFLSMFLDILCFISFPFIFISIWHSNIIFNVMKKYSLYDFIHHEINAKLNPAANKDNNSNTTSSSGYSLAWNFEFFKIFLIFLIDIPFLLCSIITICTLIYSKELYINLKELSKQFETNKDTYNTYSYKRRLIAIELFICIFTLVIASISASLVWLTRLEYPLLSYSYQAHEEKNVKILPFTPGTKLKKHLIMVDSLCRSLFDIFYFLLVIILSITLFRSFILWKHLYSLHKTALYSTKKEDILYLISKQKSHIIDQFICLLLDIPSYFCYAVLYIMHWRWNDYKIEYHDEINKSKQNKPNTSESISNDDNANNKLWHFIVLRYFGYCCTDIPAFICYVLIGVLYYRFSTFAQKWNKLWNEYQAKTLSNTLYYSSLHNLCYKTLVAYFLDIFVFIMGIAITILLFHTKKYYKKINHQKNQNLFELHKITLKYFILSIVDIPFLLLVTLVVLTYWRYNTYIQEIENIKQQKKKEKKENENNPIPISWMNKDARRKASFYCLLLMVLDILNIPSFILITVLVWNKHKLNKINEQSNNTLHEKISHRMQVLQLLFKLLFDLPFVLLCVILYCSWRSIYFYKTIQLTNSMRKKRIIVVQTFILLLLDIPAFISSYLIRIVRWQNQIFKIQMDDYENSISNLSQLERTTQYIHVHKQIMTIKYGILSIYYLPISILAGILLISWRRRIILKIIHLDDFNGKKKNILLLFVLLLFDISTWINRQIIYYTQWYKYYLIHKENSLFQNYITLTSKNQNDKVEQQNDISIELFYELKKQYSIFFILIRLIIDIPTLFCAIFVLVTFVRKKEFQQVLQRYPIQMGERREAAYRESYYVFISCMIYVEIGFLFCTFWRKNEIQKSKTKENPTKQFLYLSSHCIRFLCFDIPFLLLYIIVCNTWRRSSIINQIRFCETLGYNDKRKITLRYFICLFIDLIALDMILIIQISSFFYFTKLLIKSISSGWKKSIENEDRRIISFDECFSLHWNIYVFFGYVVLNIPFYMISKMILFPFYWRYNILTIKLQIIEKEMKKQNLFLLQPHEMENDFTFQYFLYTKKLILQQVFYLCFDLVCIVPCILVFLSWRSFHFQKKLKKQFYETIFSIKSIQMEDDDSISYQFYLHQIIKEFNIPIYYHQSKDRPVQYHEMKSIFSLHLHGIIIYEFIQCIIDVPFIIMLSLLLWRLPKAIKYLLRAKDINNQFCCTFDNANHTRTFILHEFIECIVDIPFIVIMFINFLCIWKIKYNFFGIYYYFTCNEDKITYSLRKFSMLSFVSNSIDILSFLLSLIMMITIWKIPRILSLYYQHMALRLFQLPSVSHINKMMKHGGVFHFHVLQFEEFKYWLKDIPYIPCFILLLLSPYRLFLFIQFVYGNETLTKRLQTVEHCKKVLRTWHFSDELKILHSSIHKLEMQYKRNKNKNKTDEKENETRLYANYIHQQRNKMNKANRIVLFSCSIMAVEDIAVIVMVNILLFSIWRSIDFLEEIYQHPTKKTILKQFRKLCDDFYCFISLLIIFAFLVRIPQLIYSFYIIYKQAKLRNYRIFYISFYFQWIKEKLANKKKPARPDIAPSDDSSPMLDMPDEIIYMIAQNLDPQAICRLQRVSKRFQWLDDQQLWYEKLMEVSPQAAQDTSNTRSYKLRYEQFVQQNPQMGYEEGLFTYGCRAIILHYTNLSIKEPYHTYLLPAKLFVFCVLCYTSFVHWCFPFTRAMMIMPQRIPNDFWQWHDLRIIFMSLILLVHYSLFLVSAILQGFEELFWIIFTFGSRFYNMDHRILYYCRIILFCPSFAFKFLLYGHPIILYFYFPLFWCSTWFRVLCVEIILCIVWFFYRTKFWSFPQEFVLAKRDFREYMATQSRVSRIIKQKLKSMFTFMKNKISIYLTFCKGKITNIYDYIKKLVSIIFKFTYSKYLVCYNFIKYYFGKLYNVIKYIIISCTKMITKICTELYKISSYCVNLLSNLIYKIVMRILKFVAYCFSAILNSFIIILLFLKSVLVSLKFMILGIFNLYLEILATWTCTCAKLPGVVGNLLLIPICFTWILWPCVVAFFFNYFLLFPSVLCSAFLILKGYRIVDKNWN